MARWPHVCWRGHEWHATWSGYLCGCQGQDKERLVAVWSVHHLRSCCSSGENSCGSACDGSFVSVFLFPGCSWASGRHCLQQFHRHFLLILAMKILLLSLLMHVLAFTGGSLAGCAVVKAPDNAMAAGRCYEYDHYWQFFTMTMQRFCTTLKQGYFDAFDPAFAG